MANEYKLKYTAQEIDDKLEKIDQLSEEIVDQQETVDSLTLGIASDGLIYLFKGGSPVGTGIPQGQSGDVFGYVDENNRIILKGNLAEDTYFIKYEKEDGSTVDIGELELGKEILVFTNLLDTAINPVDESVLDGVGYRRDVRISTTSPTTEPYKVENGFTSTGYISTPQGVVTDWYVYGLDFTGHSRCTIYMSNNRANLYANVSGATAIKDGTSSAGVISVTKLGDYYFKITTPAFSSKVHYIIFCGVSVAGITPIVTKGEPIIAV